jgi:type II secretory pathway component PulF
MISATNEQLTLLHQELAALAKAGMPLDSGLRSLSRALPGALGKLASEVAERLERGEGLDDALRSNKSPQQRVYAAVIAAGLRAGNLHKALESVIVSAQANDQLRQNLLAKLAYPALLIFLGCGQLRFTYEQLVPVFFRISTEFDAMNNFPSWLGNVMTLVLRWYYLLLPLLLAVFAGFCWLMFGGTSFGLTSRRPFGALGRFRSEQALHRFCELLAMLVEHSIPLPEALLLAGEASGWSRLATVTVKMSEQLRRGEALQPQPPVPATVAWLAGGDRTVMVAQLRREGARHRARAADLAIWLTRWLPLLLTLGIGLFFVVLLALATFGPFLNLLHRLSQPNNF